MRALVRMRHEIMDRKSRVRKLQDDIGKLVEEARIQEEYIKALQEHVSMLQVRFGEWIP